MSLQLLPYSFARKNKVMVDAEGITYCSSTSLTALAEAQCNLPAPARFFELGEEEFSRRLNNLYEETSSDTDLMEMELDDEDDLDLSARAAEDILESDSEAPVIRLLNALFIKAIRGSASDIHIEPYEHNLLVRFRIDGVLRDVLEANRSLSSKIISRIKVMARLDIAERRVPQDGRISLRLGDRLIDIRVSTLPCSHGERVVMRLLSRSHEELDINHSGMTPEQLELFKRLISKPHGILLVTGPTGSGKTTTLYAGLNQIRNGRTNILTIEDPVEYDLKGVGQTQVNNNTGMTFARGLRAILRQDPDVVMVGEIRDSETAEISVQASLTGHLVLSTLHTNTAVGAIARLADMGVEPFLIASSLHGVLAQRLVRLLCPHCKSAYQPDASVLDRLQITDRDVGEIYHPSGCSKCEQTGYLGRTGVFEIIEIDEATQQQIHENPSEWQVNEKINRASGTILENGRNLVVSGKTSAEEILRVIQSPS